MNLNKKLIFVLLTLIFVVQSLAFAMEAPKDGEPAEKATVALLFVNNAKSTYDDEITKKMTDNFDKTLNGKYNVVSGERYIEKLSKMGITDLTTAERADITDVFKGENVDYVLFVEIQPFIRKEKITFFTYGIDMTAIVPIKIIDLANNKYLYNGKFTEVASDSSAIGIVGNKSVALKALDKVIEKLNATVSSRLPLERPVKAAQ